MSRPKRFIKFAGITLLTTSFYACNAYRITSGNVIDAQTNRAISGVLVRDLESEERSVKTDSNGYFNIAVMARNKKMFPSSDRNQSSRLQAPANKCPLWE